LRSSAITWALEVEKMSMLPSCNACPVVWLSSMTLKVILSRYGNCTPSASFCQ